MKELVMTAAARVSARLTPVVFAAALLAMVTGCGGSSEPNTPVITKDVVPATIVASSTDTLRAVVGTAAGGAISVIVKNKEGELIDSALVTFAVTAGGGTLGNATVRTISGQASTTWTLGQTVGLQTVTATVGGLTATFNAIASASTAANITKLAGDLQTGTVGTNLPIAPSVKITDKFGNPVAGALVTFNITGGGGLLSGAAVNTGADGVATLTLWRLGSVVGVNTLTAGTGGLSVTFTATATPGTVAALALTPNTIGELSTGQTIQLTVKATDASGNTIVNPALVWTTSNSAAAKVSPTGLVTAVGAGVGTVTVTAGSATASAAFSVIGHPATTMLSAPLSVAPGVPGDIAFSTSGMHVAVPSLDRVVTFDPTGTVQTGFAQLSTPVQILLAPSAAAKPLVAINPSTLSRIWFIDPTISAVTDSIDVPEFVKSANISADGSRIYLMLSDGTLAVYDGATHTQVARVLLGGGVTATKIAPGDTLLYAVTNVGVIFEVDLRANVVKRQIIANVISTDFVIGRDGLFYLLDAPNGLVKIFDPTTLTTVRTVVVAGFGTSIGVAPDSKQFWVTHSNNLITIYNGSVTSGYLSGGEISTAGGQPIRVYFSPTGSFAAITNFGGWVDIVR
jgi:hypothetical protein